LEPLRSEDRERQDKQRKGKRGPGEENLAGKVDEDRAEVATAEPEEHTLDERA
jgi:hypothetical protein